MDVLSIIHRYMIHESNDMVENKMQAVMSRQASLTITSQPEYSN
jgi:hypothetical protein